MVTRAAPDRGLVVDGLTVAYDDTTAVVTGV